MLVINYSSGRILCVVSCHFMILTVYRFVSSLNVLFEWYFLLQNHFMPAIAFGNNSPLPWKLQNVFLKFHAWVLCMVIIFLGMLNWVIDIFVVKPSILMLIDRRDECAALSVLRMLHNKWMKSLNSGYCNCFIIWAKYLNLLIVCEKEMWLNFLWYVALFS